MNENCLNFFGMCVCSYGYKYVGSVELVVSIFILARVLNYLDWRCIFIYNLYVIIILYLKSQDQSLKIYLKSISIAKFSKLSQKQKNVWNFNILSFHDKNLFGNFLWILEFLLKIKFFVRYFAENSNMWLCSEFCFQNIPTLSH